MEGRNRQGRRERAREAGIKGRRVAFIAYSSICHDSRRYHSV